MQSTALWALWRKALVRIQAAISTAILLLASCSTLADTKPSEGMRAPEVPMVTIWRYRF